MELAYREDWPEAAERLARWWRREPLGRPAMQLTAPREGAVWEPLPEAPDLWAQWTDPAYVVPRCDQSIRCTAWYGEACPQAWVNLGPVSCAGYLGTGVHVRPDTVWQSAIVDDWEDYHPRFDPDNEWWQITVRLAEAMLAGAAGKWFVANADLGEPADIMSYLRTPQALCLDLAGDARRERLVEVRDGLTELLWGFYEKMTELVAGRMEGTSSWLGAWCPERTTTLQCDFSCMVSKAMFDDLLAPAIFELARRVDRVIYHLDGPEALQHVDTLLQMPNLRAIQWVPGSGAESAAHPRWRALLKRITSAGIGLHLAVAPGEIEGLLADLPADGLYLQTGVGSEQEARDLMRSVEGWAR
jgi:hypothetical protein